jgi:hypothetical protein
MLAPYLHSKLGAVAAPPIPIFIENQINIPHVEPKTITQSNENILYLTNLKAIGKLDLAWGDSLIADQCRVRDGLIDDAKLAIQGHEQGDQVIRIEGGMPALPGTDIIMPAINGREYDILSAYSPAIESVASDAPVPLPPDQEPGPEG